MSSPQPPQPEAGRQINPKEAAQVFVVKRINTGQVAQSDFDTEQLTENLRANNIANRDFGDEVMANFDPRAIPRGKNNLRSKTDQIDTLLNLVSVEEEGDEIFDLEQLSNSALSEYTDIDAYRVFDGDPSYVVVPADRERQQKRKELKERLEKIALSRVSELRTRIEKLNIPDITDPDDIVRIKGDIRLLRNLFLNGKIPLSEDDRRWLDQNINLLPKRFVPFR